LQLAGKVALVTGGSRGIGAATVRLFREAGAKVVFNYKSAKAAADALVAELGGQDYCVAVEQELSTPEQGRALVAKTVEAFGRIDAMVVNHGVWPPHDAPIATMAESQWRSTLSINLDSVFGLTQAAVAQMLKQTRGDDGRTGSIVYIASTAAQRGEANHADYAASKGALISLTKSLSSELAGKGIYVNCVAPGWVETDMSAPALNDPPVRERIFATIPLGRVAKPVEIAGPAVFLCTPYAGFMSGEIVNVNGGAVLVG
ncbi:SDR family NAD(P)-dependent oxidoreductase, partial [Silvibacterium sp.]|uniref:SDR family NAD(P)-dependent oxidoreductase n=1 Tax=Silvibacterium sp. TaxID=1964179 RepID=UPI0039E3DACF